MYTIRFSSTCKGSIIVKMDSLGPSYGCLKFTKCIDIYRNHKSLTSSPVKSTDA